MIITRTDYVKAKENYILDLDEITMQNINNDLHKECVELVDRTISNIDIVSVILYNGLKDQSEYTFNHFYGGKPYKATLSNWIENWFEDIICQIDCDIETYDYDDSDTSVELENDQEYVEWLKLHSGTERILLLTKDYCEEFFDMQEAVKFIYKNSIKSCNLQHQADGMIYYQSVENPDRYWLNKFGISYQELFDEIPDLDNN